MPALDDAFFEAMRRRLRTNVEGQRSRASRAARGSLGGRGLFGEGTTGAIAEGNIGAASTQALQRGMTDIQGQEFQAELQKFLIEQQKPSFLEQALPVLGGGLGLLLGGPLGASLGLGLGKSGSNLLGPSQSSNTQFRRRPRL